MAPLDLDKYVEIVRQCKYLPENDLKAWEVARIEGRYEGTGDEWIGDRYCCFQRLCGYPRSILLLETKRKSMLPLVAMGSRYSGTRARGGWQETLSLKFEAQSTVLQLLAGCSYPDILLCVPWHMNLIISEALKLPTDNMQVTICRLRTHQWCFILFNVILFHALLFGADFVEEYFLRSLPHVDMKTLDIKNKARKLNLEPLRGNPSKYYVLSQPEVCNGKTIFLLSLIFSNPGNGTRRELIRKTWGSVTSVQGYSIITLFALGMPALVTTQEEIYAESQKNNDIIEGIFLDSSENQTLKIISMTQWAVAFCPNALFILKADEEMFINLPGLVDYLLNLKGHLEGIYLGRVIHQDIPNRDPHSQEFVPLSEYPEKYYPDYCSGEAFIMSQDVARMVYVVLNKAPIMVPADVFVGICAKSVGLIPIHSSRFSGERHITYNRCCYKFIFTSSEATDAETSLAWREMNDGKECSLFETYYGLISCKLLTYLDSFKHFHTGSAKDRAVYFGD